MNDGHAHNVPVSSRSMAATMALNIAITIVELVGGALSGSMSLISDALHNLSDGVSIALAYTALTVARRQNSPRHTFGLKRAETLAAFVNSAILLVIVAFLFRQALDRILHPAAVDGRLMTLVAVFGLAANVAGTLLLHGGAKRSLNVKAAYLHLLSDAVSSASVALGGLVIVLWRVYWMDPVLTFLVGAYVIRKTVGLLAESLHVLMEGAPAKIDLKALRTAVEAVPEVEDIHHLHVWTVGENDVHLDAHVNVRDMRISEGDELRQEIVNLLRESFGVGHVTIQLECRQCPGVGLIHG